MKTKTLLIVLIIFFINVISVNAMETIKSCWQNEIRKGFNWIVFPKDGGKPYGAHVESLLSVTNRLNLQLEIEEVKEWKKCLDKMRNGEIDIMPGLKRRDDRLQYMYMIPDYDGGHYGISKKSKYGHIIGEIINNIPTREEITKVKNTNYTSSDQHDWPKSNKKEIKVKEIKEYADLKPGEPIKVNCFVSDVNVATMMPPYQSCFKDKKPDGWDEKKVTSMLGCYGEVVVGYSLGSYDLEKLRNVEENVLGLKMYDMKTEISFKDGKIFTSVSKFNTNFAGVSVQFSGEKMLRLYNREEPTGVKCEIL